MVSNINGDSDLLTVLQSRMADFSKSHKRIAAYLLEHYDKAAYLTAAKLGEAVGVSESTVVRFAIELKYDGYPKLQRALEELVKNRLTAAQRVEVSYDRMLNNNKHLVKSILEDDADRINTTLSSVDTDVFDTAVDAILNAKRIFIVGGRSSAALSYFLSFYLNLMLDNVIDASTGSVTDTFEHIFRIKEDDLLIGISFPRYSNKTIKAVSYAIENGAKTIAITDSTLSPLARGTTATLVAKSDMVSFVDSLVAPLSLINALLVAVSINRKDNITAGLDRLERLWGEYQVYSSTKKKYL